VVEGVPAVFVGILVLGFLPNGPRQAKWLTNAGPELEVQRMEADEAAKQDHGQIRSFAATFSDGRVWTPCLA
jgi:cytochrome c biogenesis protein CcdA